MELEKKLRIVRLEEEVTQSKMAEITGIPLISLKSYEQGKRAIHRTNLLKIVNHPKFSKYAMWLLMDDFEEGSKKNEQVKPAHLEEILNTIG